MTTGGALEWRQGGRKFQYGLAFCKLAVINVIRQQFRLTFPHNPYPRWTAHAMGYGRLWVMRGRFGCKIWIRWRYEL